MEPAFPVGKSCNYPTERAGRSNACYRLDSCGALIAAAQRPLGKRERLSRLSALNRLLLARAGGSIALAGLFFDRCNVRRPRKSRA